MNFADSCFYNQHFYFYNALKNLNCFQVICICLLICLFLFTNLYGLYSSKMTPCLKNKCHFVQNYHIRRRGKYVYTL